MNIVNVNQNVPDQVRQIFEGFIPFGSDYVMFCDRYSTTAGASYSCRWRAVGSSSVSSVSVSRSSSSGDWSVSSVSTLGDYDGFVVSLPYYAYSNLQGQGRYTVLASGQNLVVLMLVVCASLAVLRTVFGGIKFWRSRRKSDVY